MRSFARLAVPFLARVPAQTLVRGRFNFEITSKSGPASLKFVHSGSVEAEKKQKVAAKVVTTIVTPQDEYAGRSEVIVKHEELSQRAKPARVKKDLVPGVEDTPWTPKGHMGKTPMVRRIRVICTSLMAISIYSRRLS